MSEQNQAAIQVCTVLLPGADFDEGPRCGKPAVARLPEPLDFPVCADHAEMFGVENGSEGALS